MLVRRGTGTRPRPSRGAWVAVRKGRARAAAPRRAAVGALVRVERPGIRGKQAEG